MTEYAGRDGLAEMQELVQRVWSPVSRLHLGDVAWERSANAARAAGWRTAVWRDGGQVVASALIWLDEQHQVGLVEPVGVATAYRRRGLGQAVNLAALHALREAGGTRAVVCPRGDDGYPQARALYQSIGFQPGSRTLHLLLG